MHRRQATRTTIRKSRCRRGANPRHLKAIATEEESKDEHSRSANCHVSPNPHLHRAPATDSRRPANPTSRMGRAKWRIPAVSFLRAVIDGTDQHFEVATSVDVLFMPVIVSLLHKL